MTSECKLFIALPVLNESENLEQFIHCLANQTIADFELVVCVNQYEHWWNDGDKISLCEDNQNSLTYLRSLKDINIRIIDRSSRNFGWPAKKGGVGWARKVLMDDISDRANADDLILSMDADTHYPADYLEVVKAYFEKNTDKLGLSIPYYHRLTENQISNRLVLRYELYMRYYAHNMLRIANPYAFTALGSAIALPVWAYRKIGGMSPVKSGEDFYLLQKIVKTGPLGTWVDTTAYPSSRFSDRVLFGTGPALIKGSQGDWDSYPFYDPKSFESVRETFTQFNALYARNMHLPMDAFLYNHFGKDPIWNPLRENYKDVTNFKRACINKIDGLRILQFLRWEHAADEHNGEKQLQAYLNQYAASFLPEEVMTILKKLNFEETSINEIDSLRNWMFHEEQTIRSKFKPAGMA